jgi:hypothetical protein
MGRCQHIRCLGIVTPQTFPGYLDRIDIIRQLHQFLMIRGILEMASLAVRGPFALLLVAFHALLVVSSLETDPFRVIRIERILMTG